MDSLDPALFQENQRTAPRADGRCYLDVGELSLERGGYLPQVTVAYETWGELSAARDNAIVICHALSGDSHAIGWWERLVGPGRPIDTDQFFVIGTNSLGGCQGTTGPSSAAPDGRPWGSRFPRITVGDMIEVQRRLVEHLGIDRLLAVAGGSMGGMMALEWTLKFPVARAVITASSARHSALQIGFNEAARQAVLRDPNWCGGDYYDGEPPSAGLAVARMIGHLSYLSESAFQSKFGRALQAEPPHPKGSEAYHPPERFQVESYLNYQGDKFTHRFDANSLVVLSRAIDDYDCSALAPATSYLFISFASDLLYPSHQSQELQQMATKSGAASEWVEIDLPYGHDAFLLDGELQGEHIRRFLATM